MTTIEVPHLLPFEPEPEVKPDASAVLTDVRAAATAMSDVADWARAHGAPEDFEGDAAEAASHAVTRFASDAGVVTAALEKGVLAIDQFLTAMETRRTQHDELMHRRNELNGELQGLVAQIDGAPEEQVPELRAKAASLSARFADHHSAIDAWRAGIVSDEETAVAALRAVDELHEGKEVADQPRVDTSSLAAELARLSTDTDAIFTWWKTLSPAERNALLINDPGLIGNTNGIPTGDRDEANRASVQRDLEYLLALQASGQELTASEQRWLENAAAIERAIDIAADKLPYSTLDIDVNVLAYQPHAFGGDGIAAVAYGDPDTADHTAVYVPGIMQDGTLIDQNGQQALDLYAAADGDDGVKIATIAWIGYDSPNANPDGSLLGYPESGLDVAQTATEGNAEAGGLLLSQFVDGLNSTNEANQDGDDNSHLTVIGHSYGSTTAAHAAADGMAADTLVLIGSPGAGGGVEHVSGLNMPQGQVFVGADDHDPVTWLGGETPINLPVPGHGSIHLGNLGLGEDPSQADFGAHNFEVDAGEEFHGAVDLVNTGLLDNHVSYFEPTNAALGNMADIMTGHGAEVGDTGGRDQDAHDYLYDWAASEAQHQMVDPIVDGAVQTYEGVHDGVNVAIDSGQDVWDTVWPDVWP